MATTDLSAYDFESVPKGDDFKIAIVAAEWNFEITGALAKGAKDTLLKHGVKEENIKLVFVPGTFELTFGAQKLVHSVEKFDAVIALGCVIQGETRHFDFICQGVTQGITDLNRKFSTPVIYGVLTTDNQQQALDRSGGIHGNKGDEAAVTALKMIAFNQIN